MKKLAALILALMFVLCACAPAANTPTDGTTVPSGDSSASTPSEPVKLRIAVSQHEADVIEDENFGTKYSLAQAAEALGYEIEWIPVRQGETKEEQIATLMAGDVPDVFLGLLSDSLIAENASMFVPLEDKIEQYCPNVYATYTQDVDGWESFLTYPDGHIYGLMCGFQASYSNLIYGTMWINQTWLDNLGMKVPTNLSELETVLAAFRDKDANGNGDAGDEIPFDWCQSHYAAKYYELAHSFGLPIEGESKLYDIVDGEVIPVLRSDAFREYLEYFHQLTVDGLANVEGATQTEEQYYSNIAGGKSGVFFGWAPYTYITDADLQAQYVAVGPLSADGYTFRVQQNALTATRNGFVVTTACENVEAALKLWDYMSRDQKAAMEARYGPEGLTFEYVDGVAVSRAYTAEDAIAFGYENLASQVGTSAFNASMGLTLAHPLVIDAPAAAPGTTSAVRDAAVELYEPCFMEQTMSKGIIPTDAKEEYTFMTDGMYSCIKAFAADSIVNGVTDDSWNAFLSNLDTYGYDYYIQYYQNYLDGSWD